MTKIPGNIVYIDIIADKRGGIGMAETMRRERKRKMFAYLIDHNPYAGGSELTSSLSRKQIRGSGDNGILSTAIEIDHKIVTKHTRDRYIAILTTFSRDNTDKIIGNTNIINFETDHLTPTETREIEKMDHYKVAMIEKT